MPRTKTNKILETKRDGTLDFLRGMAVILMIFVHATAYFLGNKNIFYAWDYTHIVVPLFVFCSSYLFFKKNDYSFSFKKTRTRILRLYLPYLTLFVIPSMIIYAFLSPEKFNLQAFTNLLSLGNSRDVGWLVSLFGYLLILNPILLYLYNRRHLIFIIFTGASFLSTIFLLFYNPPFPFRLIMWLPWSAFLIFALLFSKFAKNPLFYFITLPITAFIFLLSREFLIQSSQTLVFTENKYPPNIYYLSYGAFFTAVLYLAYNLFEKLSIFPNFLKRSLSFLSRFSYQIFFIHFLIVKIFTELSWHTKIGWFGFFVVLLFGSVGVVLLSLNIKKRKAFLRNR